ncbi:Putative methionine and alanine importer, small subunit [Mesobacillus persicus]|uniref:Putative methionine and alanine importer, small subunit n=1 Tax=Mesobacillus persicus TaxID=930146 RepID=A0A1H7ZUA3_9BACI|nr:methionine/alanine import family NSS transporter small subunit [Mesobacillus persicus]SEM62212.1 Putative methionine and alanine importer, small subunit [Mesobacillus persicus]
METSAVVMMVIGMVIIWGGLAASITHAVRKSRS